MTDEPEIPEPEVGTSALEKAATVAATLLRHKQLLVAAMEMLREKQVLSEEDQVKILNTYEQGSAAARSAIHGLIGKLQESNLGKVVIDVGAQIPASDLTPEGLRAAAKPYIAAVKEEFRAEAAPYLEKARERLVELKALEEPTLRRLEAIGADFKVGAKEIAKGLKGVGREAADELVRRGKNWFMSAETEELEREFFDWALKALPKAEQAFVRILVGAGLLLLVSGLLLAAQEFAVFKQAVIVATIFLLIALGFLLLNWGIKVSEALKASKGDIERLAKMTPGERRIYLAQRWAKRAEEEGVITSEEAATVIEETIMAASEPKPSPQGPAGPSA